jgi:type II secretory pathway component GspD/PulD (secretin)
MKTFPVLRVLPAVLLAFAFCPALHAQDKPADKPADAPAVEHKAYKPYDPAITDCRKQSNRTQQVDCSQAHYQLRTVFLHNAEQQNDANEILVAVRNMFDPGIRVYLLASHNAITIGSYPEDLDRIEAYIRTLDIPRPTYRLTYTLTDFEGDKRVGTQHDTIVLVAGQRMTFKQGSKIPVATGSYNNGATAGSAAGAQTQFTYLDVGMNVDATLTEVAGGGILKTKIEQSSVGPEPAVIAGVAEPIIRQTVLEGTPTLVSGKPLTLGSIDIVGSTHRLEITVLLEPIR